MSFKLPLNGTENNFTKGAFFMAKVKLVIRSFIILVIILLVVWVLPYLCILYNFDTGDSVYINKISKKTKRVS